MKSRRWIAYLVVFLVIFLAIFLIPLIPIRTGPCGEGVCPTQCITPAGFGCLGYVLSTNGTLQLNLMWSTNTTINITAYGCNTNDTIQHMQIPARAIYMPKYANVTLTMQCWVGSRTYSGALGQVFEGYAFVNYTDSGFEHTIPIRLLIKVVKS